MEQMLTVQDVADFLGVHYMFARTLIIGGDLSSVTVGSMHRVAPASLRGFCVSRGARLVDSALPMLTSEKVAADLKVSRNTVLRMCGDGRLPAAHIGKIWRISPADLQAFVRGEVTPPAPPAEAPGGPLGVAVGPSPRAGGEGGRGDVGRKVG